MNSYTPQGTVSQPTMTGTPATLTGTVSTPTFTGTQASYEPVYFTLAFIMKT
jgi:hypothetical protein